MSDFLRRIGPSEEAARALEARMADPQLAKSPREYTRLARELGALKPLVEAGEAYRRLLKEAEGAQEMLRETDPELLELARNEVEALGARRAELEATLEGLLVPKDPNDEKNVILEIRAGAGGDEAALFAGDLFRMYSRYAEGQGWTVELLSRSETGKGGMKEVIAGLRGGPVYGLLKFERGVHRVQRVPITESAGRIHTSTVTVAVLPEAEEVEFAIDPKDLRIDVFRSSGPGGQSVNTTDSAVRITHVPSGVVVQCQDEKSQHKNKARAMKILRARLLQAEEERKASERASERRSQVGTGDRSERIRTYNFPQSRVTDHRAGVTLHRLESILQGEIGEMLETIRVALAERAQREDAA